MMPDAGMGGDYGAGMMPGENFLSLRMSVHPSVRLSVHMSVLI